MPTFGFSKQEFSPCGKTRNALTEANGCGSGKLSTAAQLCSDVFAPVAQIIRAEKERTEAMWSELVLMSIGCQIPHSDELVRPAHVPSSPWQCGSTRLPRATLRPCTPCHIPALAAA